jgi:hypothetical protein
VLPFFLTVTVTRGAHSHVDVTRWFVLAVGGIEAVRPTAARHLVSVSGPFSAR